MTAKPVSWAAALAFPAALSLGASAQSLTRAECEANIQRQLARMEAGVAAGLPGRVGIAQAAQRGARVVSRRQDRHLLPLGRLLRAGVWQRMVWAAHAPEDRQELYYQHHVEIDGEPDEHPYHNFIPQFTAEKFDAAEWADLFVKAGASVCRPGVRAPRRLRDVGQRADALERRGHRPKARRDGRAWRGRSAAAA